MDYFCRNFCSNVCGRSGQDPSVGRGIGRSIRFYLLLVIFLNFIWGGEDAGPVFTLRTAMSIVQSLQVNPLHRINCVQDPKVGIVLTQTFSQLCRFRPHPVQAFRMPDPTPSSDFAVQSICFSLTQTIWQLSLLW